MLHILSSVLFLLLSTFAIKTSNPSGTISLHSNTFIDQNEVSNLAWIEYINWLSKTHGKTSTEVQNAMPDSAAYSALYKEDFNPSTFRNKYVNFPVVGISYKQAVAYCAWRSDRVNQLGNMKHTVRYRLPTTEEFEMAKSLEKAGDSKNHNAEVNLYSTEEKTRGKQVYHVLGNVSEMTDKVGIAFGGKEGEGMPKAYTEPSSWLGFRCVAELN